MWQTNQIPNHLHLWFKGITFQVFTRLICGKTQLKGRYSLSVPLITKKTDQNFVLNINQPTLSYETTFLTQNGLVTFVKSNDSFLRIHTVSSELPADLKKYQTSKLLEGISAKLHEKVQKNIGVEDIRSHINRHMLHKHLTAIGERLKSTVFKVLNFNQFHSDISDVVHFDTTDFQVCT